MKTHPQNIPLPHRNNIPRIVLRHRLRLSRLHLVHPPRQFCKHLDIGSVACFGAAEDFFHDRRSDEDSREGSGGFAEEGQGEAGFEALDLAAEVVAVHADAEPADEFLAALFGGIGFVREEDQAGASSPDWFLLDSAPNINNLLRNRGEMYHLLDIVAEGL